MFNFLALREMKVKNTLRFHLTPFKTAITKKTKNNKCWYGCGGK
jgi:hypothetical protein